MRFDLLKEQLRGAANSFYSSVIEKVERMPIGAELELEGSDIDAIIKSLWIDIRCGKSMAEALNNMRKKLQKSASTFIDEIAQIAGQKAVNMILSGYTNAAYLQAICIEETCTTCIKAAERIISLEEAAFGDNLPPEHPNCDCGILILDENRNEIGRLENLGKRVQDTIMHKPSEAEKTLPWYEWLLKQLSDKEETYLKKFSEGNALGGLLNLAGVTVGLPKSLYLNAINAVTSMLKGEDIRILYNMDYRDYSEEQKRKFGGKTMFDLTAELKEQGLLANITGNFADMALELMNDPLFVYGMYKAAGAAKGVKTNAGAAADDVGKVKVDNLDDFVNNPQKLGEATPEQYYKYFQDNGFNPKPLNDGNFKGMSFEQGGGFKINWGGDRILQYHPPGLNHHGGGAYWKVSSGPTGVLRFDLNGNLITR